MTTSGDEKMFSIVQTTDGRYSVVTDAFDRHGFTCGSSGWESVEAARADAIDAGIGPEVSEFVLSEVTDAEPCDCGGVRGPGGFFRQHVRGEDPQCEHAVAATIRFTEQEIVLLDNILQEVQDRMGRSGAIVEDDEVETWQEIVSKVDAGRGRRS